MTGSILGSTYTIQDGLRQMNNHEYRLEIYIDDEKYGKLFINKRQLDSITEFINKSWEYPTYEIE